MKNKFLFMKQKLSCLQKVFRIEILNILLLIPVIIILWQTILLNDQLNVTKKYVSDYLKTNKINAASNLEQSKFDQLTTEAGLSIDNKNVSFVPLEENEEIVQASYDLLLSGSYIKFLEYLNLLYDHNMLYKISLLKLKIDSSNKLKISFQLESLYEMD